MHAPVSMHFTITGTITNDEDEAGDGNTIGFKDDLHVCDNRYIISCL